MKSLALREGLITVMFTTLGTTLGTSLLASLSIHFYVSCFIYMHHLVTDIINFYLI